VIGAVRCRVCGRRLRSARSVRLGMGPVCGRRAKAQLELFPLEVSA